MLCLYQIPTGLWSCPEDLIIVRSTNITRVPETDHYRKNIDSTMSFFNLDRFRFQRDNAVGIHRKSADGSTSDKENQRGKSRVNRFFVYRV